MNNRFENDLHEFYEACHNAPVPASLTATPRVSAWWVKLIIPIGGISFGALLAVGLLATPVPTTEKEGIQLARAIRQHQYELAIHQPVPVLPSPTPSHVANPNSLRSILDFRTRGVRWNG